MSLYEHFPAYDESPEDAPSSRCPTCRGTGLLADESQGSTMVTFTRLDDQRLQPRHTLRYAVLGVTLVTAASLLIAFFIYPRPVVLSRDSSLPFVLPPLWTQARPKNATFEFENAWSAYNPSFFGVEVVGFEVQMSWSFQLPADDPVCVVNNSVVVIPARTELQIRQKLLISFTGELGWVSDFYCMDPCEEFFLTTSFQAIATIDAMGVVSSNIVQSFQRVSCCERLLRLS